MQAAAATIHRRMSTQALRERMPRRGAMTLVELLLVLVLLVIVGSLAAPLFEGSFSSIRLRRGTDQVLAAWSDARTHAIEAGRVYQFRFKPEGNSYRVDPWTGGLETDPALQAQTTLGSNLSESESITTTGSGASDEEQELLDWKLEETLPEQITFNSAERLTEDEAGQRQVMQLNQGVASEWSAPILFFPDGRTSSASLLLKNNNDVYCRATLRSLTGVGRASEILARDQINQNSAR